MPIPMRGFREAGTGEALLAALVGMGVIAAPSESDAMYVGPKAQGWDKLTGRFTSLMDRMQRAEISDVGASIPVNIRRKWANNQLFSEDNYALAEVYKHPELYKQYPELQDALVTFRKGVGGETMEPEPGMFHISVGTGAKSNKELLETLTHEVQHPIQSKEGWARGGSEELMALEGLQTPFAVKRSQILNKRLTEIESTVPRGKGVGVVEKFWKEHPGLFEEKQNISQELFDLSKKDSFTAYRNLSGEIEARDTAARMGLNSAQRTATAPYSGQGIPLSDTITKMGVAAPVGAVLAEMIAEKSRRAGSEALQEPLMDPTTLLAGPARAGGGVANMAFDALMKLLMGQ